MTQAGFKMLKNGEVYAPGYVGKCDILIFNDQIASIGKNLDSVQESLPINVIDVTGKIVVPGFIDCHVHFNGGGGVGNRLTRCPDIPLSKLTRAGVTTAIGSSSVDYYTKGLPGLLSKAQMLDAEGISTYILTGGYHSHSITLTETIISDFVCIDKIIGYGELALSESRSIEPDLKQLLEIASQTYIGGMITEKAGVLVIHLGGGKKRVSLVNDLINETEIPLNKFIVTHVNRNQELMDDALELSNKMVNIDVTAGLRTERAAQGSFTASKAVKWLLDAGAPLETITISSDGYGARPNINKEGVLEGVFMNEIDYLFEEFRELVVTEGLDLAEALTFITSNPAKIYHLADKGLLVEGKSADLVVLDQKLDIDKVIAKGKIMVDEGEVVIKSYFE